MESGAIVVTTGRCRHKRDRNKFFKNFKFFRYRNKNNGSSVVNMSFNHLLSNRDSSFPPVYYWESAVREGGPPASDAKIPDDTEMSTWVDELLMVLDPACEALTNWLEQLHGTSMIRFDTDAVILAEVRTLQSLESTMEELCASHSEFVQNLSAAWMTFKSKTEKPYAWKATGELSEDAEDHITSICIPLVRTHSKTTRQNPHLSCLALLASLELASPDLAQFWWNCTAEVDHDSRVHRNIGIYDTFRSLGYKGHGLKVKAEFSIDLEDENARLLGYMLCVCRQDTHEKPKREDIYQFHIEDLNVVCPTRALASIGGHKSSRVVSGGFCGLIDDAHGEVCIDKSCSASNVEFVELKRSCFMEYMGTGTHDPRSLTIQCMFTKQSYTKDEWLVTHYGNSYDWSTPEG
jgi:hypothetical protein